jgi:hypothetical protein
MALAIEALAEAMKVWREEEKEKEEAELIALAVNTRSSLLFVCLLLIVRKELVADDIALLLINHPRY